MAAGWVDAAAIGAGALIAGVGIFVLAAKPRSPLHRLFFALALLDGASTALYAASVLAPSLAAGNALQLAYWIAFLPFVACLAGFGVLFPRPPRARWRTHAALAAIGLVAAALLALLLARPAWFWSASFANGRVALVAGPAGNLVSALFEATVAGLVARLTLGLLRDGSGSRRAQDAYVLGGMTLAYAPGATIALLATLTASAAGLWTGRLDRVLARDAFALLVVALLASAALLVRARLRGGRREASFVLGCFAGVLALTLTSLLFPASAPTRLPRVAAFVAYPLLLGYAIARWEVFDIDARLRRAAIVSVATAALGALFVLAQNVAQALVQDHLAEGIPDAFVASSLAALLTAALSIPVVRLSRRLGERFLPRMSVDAERARKREIYRHALEGALDDGIVEPRESRTLQALRATLGLDEADHEAILAEVRAAGRPRAPPPAPPQAPAL